MESVRGSLLSQILSNLLHFTPPTRSLYSYDTVIQYNTRNRYTSDTLIGYPGPVISYMGFLRYSKKHGKFILICKETCTVKLNNVNTFTKAKLLSDSF